MNDAQLKSLAAKAEPCMISVDRGLYFRISKEGSAFWVFRYSIGGKRRQLFLGNYGRAPAGISLRDARDLVAHKRADVKNGIDPLAEKKRSKLIEMTTVNQVAEDWLFECAKRLEHPQIPARVYKNDIAPAIGELAIKRVTPPDILGIVRSINESGRPTISNDALTYCKQLFNHAVKLGLFQYNPALALSPKDAGGVEKSRTRILSLDEIKTVFQVFRDNAPIFTRDNYLAVTLLLLLGVRKGELIAAKWNEFDLDKLIRTLPAERTKTKVEIKIPLPELTREWFVELRYRTNASEYLFPSRRASKRRGYISDDTLNHALAKLFGLKVDGNKKPLPNFLGSVGVEHFVIHDLRRTCRSLLAELGIPSRIAERCLNHKIRGIEGVYDRYDYFEERKRALHGLSETLSGFL
ncbi:site-specific integrase [Paraglaciecola sp. 20A4]|uniref:tyrosine-type recombinase/integrase n=1 Tax=Paraglaciecola sp. 20A4 TaxID=2687288 RepID=UPI00140D707C|nr:site-specific integrase [Paraglaciecola sp. 20A4]